MTYSVARNKVANRCDYITYLTTGSHPRINLLQCAQWDVAIYSVFAQRRCSDQLRSKGNRSKPAYPLSRHPTTRQADLAFQGGAKMTSSILVRARLVLRCSVAPRAPL